MVPAIANLTCLICFLGIVQLSWPVDTFARALDVPMGVVKWVVTSPPRLGVALLIAVPAIGIVSMTAREVRRAPNKRQLTDGHFSMNVHTP